MYTYLQPLLNALYQLVSILKHHSNNMWFYPCIQSILLLEHWETLCQVYTIICKELHDICNLRLLVGYIIRNFMFQ